MEMNREILKEMCKQELIRLVAKDVIRFTGGTLRDEQRFKYLREIDTEDTNYLVYSLLNPKWSVQVDSKQYVLLPWARIKYLREIVYALNEDKKMLVAILLNNRVRLVDIDDFYSSEDVFDNLLSEEYSNDFAIVEIPNIDK